MFKNECLRPLFGIQGTLGFTWMSSEKEIHLWGLEGLWLLHYPYKNPKSPREYQAPHKCLGIIAHALWSERFMASNHISKQTRVNNMNNKKKSNCVCLDRCTSISALGQSLPPRFIRRGMLDASDNTRKTKTKKRMSSEGY